MFRLTKKKKGKENLTATELKVQYFFYACEKSSRMFRKWVYKTIIEFKFIYHDFTIYTKPMSYGFSYIVRIDGTTTEKSFFGHLPLRELKL